MTSRSFACVFVFVTCVVVYCFSSAKAMTFRTQWNPEEKINVIVGEGPIEEGDAGRLEKVIPFAGRDSYGNIALYLNSLGGSVKAAFEVVEVMDREEFSALVSSGARCASACASIIYISARFHQVIGTGLLGIHTCYIIKGQSGPPEPSSFCNEVIAQNAVNHGTSYGAVQMWQRHYAPDQMAWIGQDVACKYGLCGPPGFDETLAVPSYNCAVAKLPSEIAICSNKRLARHEASLSKFYLETLNAMSATDKERFRVEQRAWLQYRNSCQGDAIDACLLQRMKDRKSEVLQKWGKYVLKTESE
jgi:uncharacterized protein YecT (DUF1311 family)